MLALHVMSQSTVSQCKPTFQLPDIASDNVEDEPSIWNLAMRVEYQSSYFKVIQPLWSFGELKQWIEDSLSLSLPLSFYHSDFQITDNFENFYEYIIYFE